MRDNLYRLWLAILLIGVALIVARNVYGQEPAATIVGPVKLSVRPLACVPPCEVRVELHIQRHVDNRAWSISMSNAEQSQAEVSGAELDGENSEAVFPICFQSNLRPCFRTLRYRSTYLFIGCVHRKEGNEIKAYCDRVTVVTDPGEASWSARYTVSFARNGGQSIPSSTLTGYSLTSIPIAVFAGKK